MKPLVSIIVPVFNLEKYISNCLFSLMNQTYHNLEILCIDDGSTDSSGDVIRELSVEDNRIVYIKKENGGVSSARNLGLDVFKGDFVMFVDGDDYLHPQAIELFVECIEKTGCGIACAGVQGTDATDVSFEKLIDIRFDKVKTDELMFDGNFSGLMSSCSKLYSKKSLKNIYFDENLIYSEDTIFVFDLLMLFNEVAIINKNLYYYFHREGSATRVEFKIKKSNTIGAFSALCDRLAINQKDVMLDKMLIYLYKFILAVRTQAYGSRFFKAVNSVCKDVGKRWLKRLIKAQNIGLSSKAQFIIFFFSRHIYEFARLLADPTMKDFYRNRRKHNG